MGQLDHFDDDSSYETRELAWELAQQHMDDERIRFLMETGADLRRALTIAKMTEKDLSRHPHLRHLHLERHLQMQH